MLIAVTTALLAAAAVADQPRPIGLAEDARHVAYDDASPSQEAQAFFEKLVERYRGLGVYEDTVDVVQVTTRDQRSHRVETRIACTIEDGTLSVETPGSQVRDGIGLRVPITRSAAIEALVLRYNLWLAPHLTLRFADEPLKEFRMGVSEGFTPTKIEPVTLDDKQFIRLELTSGDGLSEDARARFNLYVNPSTMLIERIEGRQRLPDGADYQTTLQITPIVAG